MLPELLRIPILTFSFFPCLFRVFQVERRNVFIRGSQISHPCLAQSDLLTRGVRVNFKNVLFNLFN